ncbi:MAG: hypothetical protein IKF90_18450 [Parasporobacterium sp.]|nr:hypothetical protein [Parasporobacterium sp.]
MGNQISVFEMLGLPETPTIPLEEQKEGTIGYFIESVGWYKENTFAVTVRKMMLTSDTMFWEESGWWQYTRSIDSCGGDGWSASPHTMYAKPPTWAELMRYVKDHNKGKPEEFEIVYVKKNRDAMFTIVPYEY